MSVARCALLAAALTLAACATGKPVVYVDEGVSLASYRWVYVAEIDHFDRAPDAEVARVIGEKIRTRLGEHGIALTTEPAADATLVLDTRLSRYAYGDAIQRWAVAGAGATECLVEGDLQDGKTGAKLGVVVSYRTVSSGGLYSAGAGTWILDVVATDIADELAEKMKGTP